MIRRALIVAAWIAGTAPFLAALYWAFLSTPESNVLTLTLSAALAVAIVLAGAVVVNAAVMLAAGMDPAAALRAAVRGLHWAVAAAIPLAGAVWLVVMGDAWIAEHSGEISAWSIARLNWTDVTPLLRAADYVSAWLRWVVLPAAAVAVLAEALHRGPRSVLAARWLRAAWHWRTLAIATAAYVSLIVVPWRLAFWRPEGLPPTWVQPASAAVRLLVVALLLAIGASLILVAATRAAVARTDAGRVT